MSGTFGDVAAATALGLTLWTASAGAGSAILPRRPLADANGNAEPADWRHAGVAACVGLGALMFLGGIAVVFLIPWWVVAFPFVVIGLALAARELLGRGLRRPTNRTMTIIGVATVAALILVAASEAVVGFRFPLHPWDDLRAYLPLAHRLIDTAGLEDAWNARRLQTVGGFTFLQAMPVAIFGHAGLGLIETMLGTIFLGGFFVGNGLRTTWARLISLAFILAIPFFWVPRINTTGVLMGAPLLVAVLAICIETRRALRQERRTATLRWAAAGGIVITALLSVRPNLGLLAAALTVGAMLLLGPVQIGTRVVALATSACAAILALVPWSIASMRTVSTPFYLLDPGNQNAEAVKLPGANSILDVVEHASHLLRAGPYLWVALLALVLAVLARRQLEDAPLTLVAGVVTIGVIVAVAFTGYTMAKIAFVRYTAPMSEALAIFVFYELLRSADAGARVPAVEPRRIRLPFLGIGAAAVIVAVSYSSLGLNLEYPTAPGGATLLARAFDNDLQPAAGFEVTSPQLRSAYKRALARLDPDRTIAAVDRPYLIDYERYDIPNMDLPGFTAPDGRFPFLTGPRAKVARLRAAGYDTLLATVPATDIALNPFALMSIRALRLPSYSPTTRYYLDWEKDLLALAEEAPDAVTRFGPLLVVDLRQAERDLASGPRGS